MPAESKIQDAILAFDRDGDGMLNENEIILVVRSLGLYLDSTKETELLKSIGTNGGLTSGDVRQHTCVREETRFSLPQKILPVLTKLYGAVETKQLLTTQFKRFDRANDGTIKEKELAEILRTIGDLLTEPEQIALCKLGSRGGAIPYAALIDKLIDL